METAMRAVIPMMTRTEYDQDNPLPETDYFLRLTTVMVCLRLSSLSVHERSTVELTYRFFDPVSHPQTIGRRQIEEDGGSSAHIHINRSSPLDRSR